MAKRSQTKGRNSRTPAAQAATGAPTAPAAVGEDVAQAGTAASSDATGAKQPAGDPAPSPVAGLAVEEGASDTGAAAAAPASAASAVAADRAGVSGGVDPDTPVACPPVRTSVDVLIANFDRARGAVIEVTGPKAGRRRAGRAFGAEPVRLTLAELGEADLRAIDTDPALSWALVGEMVGDDA